MTNISQPQANYDNEEFTLIITGLELSAIYDGLMELQGKRCFQPLIKVRAQYEAGKVEIVRKRMEALRPQVDESPPPEEESKEPEAPPPEPEKEDSGPVAT